MKTLCLSVIMIFSFYVMADQSVTIGSTEIEKIYLYKTQIENTNIFVLGYHSPHNGDFQRAIPSSLFRKLDTQMSAWKKLLRQNDSLVKNQLCNDQIIFSAKNTTLVSCGDVFNPSQKHEFILWFHQTSKLTWQP